MSTGLIQDPWDQGPQFVPPLLTDRRREAGMLGYEMSFADCGVSKAKMSIAAITFSEI